MGRVLTTSPFILNSPVISADPVTARKIVKITPIKHGYKVNYDICLKKWMLFLK